MSRRSQKLMFPNGRGETLAGRLELPAGEPTAFALFAHCFTCSKDVAAASRISAALAGLGFGVLRFDFTGLGNSEGDFANTNFSSNVEDLVAAADQLRSSHDAPVLLIGHSLGGAAVLAAAPRVPEARGVVTIGAPSEPGHVEKLLATRRSEIESEGCAVVALAGREFRIKKQFLDDIRQSELAPRLRNLRKALLVLHSPIDDIVGIDHARRIFEAAIHPKSFVSLDTADHLLTRREDSSYVAAIISAWSSRFLEAGAPEATGEQSEPRGTVLVTERGPLYAQRIVAGPHILSADEPGDVGGGDTGPTPYDLLLAALGSCTTMTLRMYANRKGWPLERVSVRLTHEKVHAEDCKECETREGRVDRIERRIELRGELDEEQRKRLLEIADRCPVHRTLEGEIVVRTSLVD